MTGRVVARLLGIECFLLQPVRLRPPPKGLQPEISRALAREIALMAVCCSICLLVFALPAAAQDALGQSRIFR